MDDNPKLVSGMIASLESAPMGKYDTLWVSVSPHMSTEKTAHGVEFLARWVCWSVCFQGKEVVPPEFSIVGEKITAEYLKHDLPKWLFAFKGVAEF
ncbi:hypothetical protein [Salinibius halmophilus]|uniref:hypothetical protein n=1 Tax=Salinibius halmophilus TaxID=1853216 RepID=UPI000E65FEB9|nr:hypothetical protein [Salinibius halmophilus]